MNLLDLDYPPMMTLDMVAEVFHITGDDTTTRRRQAIDVARRWRLPVMEISPTRRLVPRWAVEQIMTTGEPFAAPLPTSASSGGARTYTACAPNIEEAS